MTRVGHVALCFALWMLQAQKSPAERTWLVVLDGAERVTELSPREVRYLVHEPYPAETAVAQIQNALRLRGWTRVGQSSDGSNLTGEVWSNFEDQSRRFVYQWMTDWMDASNERVTYILRYRYESGSNGTWRPNDALEVVASFVGSRSK